MHVSLCDTRDTVLPSLKHTVPPPPPVCAFLLIENVADRLEILEFVVVISMCDLTKIAVHALFNNNSNRLTEKKKTCTTKHSRFSFFFFSPVADIFLRTGVQ